MSTTLTWAGFQQLYAGFHAPITNLDCGNKCSPYNENGIPFCCDIRHAVPAAYRDEWEYLSAHTNLWHPWSAETAEETARLQNETPPGQVLIQCLGHTQCQRSYRALTCRAFPFFPYIDPSGAFIGLCAYWEYEDRCWVISNLTVVTPDYVAGFVHTFDLLFAARPQELEQFRHHSEIMRRVFERKKRAIYLLHRDGGIYRISPRTNRMNRLRKKHPPKFGPYAVAARLRFPDEI